jgi:hypothetical protein
MARHFFEQLSGIVDSTNTCPRILVAHRRDRQLSWTDESPPPPGCIDAARICTASTCALRQTHRRYPTGASPPTASAPRRAPPHRCSASTPPAPVAGWMKPKPRKGRTRLTQSSRLLLSLSLSLSPILSNEYFFHPSYLSAV